MENTQIIDLWRSYAKKLDESLLVNEKNTAEITRIKVQSLLASMKPLKIFALLVGFLWVIFIDSLIINLFPVASGFFLVSAVIQVILTKLAIGIYLYQLILLRQADISEPVLATQQKLAGLRSSTLWVARLLFLQLPVWTTFYWNKNMLETGNIWLYLLQFIVTAFFTVLAVWLFFNIRYENRHKKWFRFFFSGNEWQPVLKSMELLEEIKAYKSEN